VKDEKCLNLGEKQGFVTQRGHEEREEDPFVELCLRQTGSRQYLFLKIN
jgi:hypothetical protein